MDYRRLHPWKIGPKRAIVIQKKLRKEILLKGGPKSIRKVAGVDVAFDDDKALAFIAVFEFPHLFPLQVAWAVKEVRFPYIPGLLTFREGPAILAAWRKIKLLPDIVIFDGQGICHPRRMGLAAHMGIILDIPAIGCAKSLLYGTHKSLLRLKGKYCFIEDRDTKEILGAALCTRTGVKPVFVSPGYRIDLRKSLKVILALSVKFRIPEPLRYSHRLAKQKLIEYLRA